MTVSDEKEGGKEKTGLCAIYKRENRGRLLGGISRREKANGRIGGIARRGLKKGMLFLAGPSYGLGRGLGW